MGGVLGDGKKNFRGKNAEETAGSCVNAFLFPRLLTSVVGDLRDIDIISYLLKKLLT